MKFAGYDISALSALPLKTSMRELLAPFQARRRRSTRGEHPEQALEYGNASRRTSRRASVRSCSSGWAISRSIAPRPRCHPVSCSDCGWRREFARICSVWCTCSTSRRRALHPADTEALLAALDQLDRGRQHACSSSSTRST